MSVDEIDAGEHASLEVHVHWLLPDGAPLPEITSDGGGRMDDGARRCGFGDRLAFTVLRRKAARDVGHVCDARHGSSHHPFSIRGDKLAHPFVIVFTGVSTGA